MKISIKDSTLVKPSKPTPTKRVWSSNLDLIVGRIHLLTVYFYKPNGSSNFFDNNVMKKALSNVLVSFYPMAGRLARDEHGRIEINCNGEGVLFVDAESDSCVDDFGDFTPSLELRKLLIPSVDTSGDISSFPLVIFQLVASVAIPPFIDRTLLRARDPPMPSFEHVEYHPPPTLNSELKNRDSSTGPKPSTTAMLKFSSEQLGLLKSKSKHEGSTYEILAAPHIWRCTCKARGLPDDQLTKLHVATDGRSRLCPVLATWLPRKCSLDRLAKRIHNALMKMNDDYLRSALDYLELLFDLSSLIRGPTYFASPNLNINSWTRLPVYDSDFGWGRPIHMGPACILYEGTVYIIPSPNNKDRNLLLAVCLDADHMPQFQKYLYEF
ncbi:unnamed protein product [Withania somnifera]